MLKEQLMVRVPFHALSSMFRIMQYLQKKYDRSLKFTLRSLNLL